MRLTFCGGAGEVGASCYLLNIDGKNILLDCGIRLNASKDSLPDFRLIQENGGVDAIIISHAHLDHTGSLPIISREYPEVPIYMTHATKDLVRVLLYDSLKIMDQCDGEIPIYAPKHVEMMLGRIICFSPEYPFEPFKEGQVKVTFYHAGHIAGASAIYIQGQEGSFFYSGDISVTNQQTVGGASIPKLRPDAALIESTYGNRLHANREVEEERLLASVREVIENGGKMLIPAFALGRAQEIILILKKAMNKGTIPKFKIYVDGMVREICRVYRLNPNYLRPMLAKKIWRNIDIFFDDLIEPVTSKDMRESIVDQSEPCCIISSSGMLTGGPSQWYAEKLAGDEKNFIAITGYQDEESPGRQLLELIDKTEEERWLEIGERKIPLKCRIGKYGLSAHADRGEIIGLVHSITPKVIFLVHGDREAIKDLGRHMQADIRGRVYLAENGESHDIRIGKARKQLNFNSITSMASRVNPQGEDDLEKLWQHIMEHGGEKYPYSAEELLRIWKGDFSFEEDEIREFIKLLNDSIYFEPDYRRPFLFRLLSKEAVQEQLEKFQGPMEINQMLSLADEYFPPQTGLYKKGARFDEKIVLLNFNFPLVARERYKEQFKKFEEETGWKVELNQECNLEAAENLLLNLLPPEVEFNGKLSYYRAEGYFKTFLQGDEKLLKQIQDGFKEHTGLELRLSKEKAEGFTTPVSAQEGQMEQNRAFELIERTFADRGVKIYKKGLKRDDRGQYIELSFISPEIGQQWQDVIKHLEEETCWNIRIAKNPNQNEILKLARRMLEGADLYLKKNPGFFQLEKRIKVVPAGEWDQEVFRKVQEQFKSQTGYDLSL